MIWVFSIVLFLFLATMIVDYIISAPGYQGPKMDHFDGKRFTNYDGVRARGFLDVIKWSFTGDPGEWNDHLKDGSSTYGDAPPDLASEGETRVTYVNHATFLIQTDGLNILTDPIWSMRASPFQWIGPKRMRLPGIRFEDLPEIHLVLISHNHYDHLDLNTVKRLNDRFQPLFVTPLGVSTFLRNHGITNTFELDWWDERQINEEVAIAGVPAQHFSGRGLTDRDKTLWCGYILQTPTGNIYFAGDTGYDGFFKKIGYQYAPIDLALIPIGAYRPRWFMSPIHVNPEEAVLIHRDVQSELSIGMHFGTFPMADDGMEEPVEDLAVAREKYQVPDSSFITLKEGHARTFKIKAVEEVPKKF